MTTKAADPTIRQDTMRKIIGVYSSGRLTTLCAGLGHHCDINLLLSANLIKPSAIPGHYYTYKVTAGDLVGLLEPMRTKPHTWTELFKVLLNKLTNKSSKTI